MNINIDVLIIIWNVSVGLGPVEAFSIFMAVRAQKGKGVLPLLQNVKYT